MNAYLATQLDKLSNGAVDEMDRALYREIGGDEYGDYDTHKLALDAYEALAAAGYQVVSI